jgi:hypothetical protein
MRYHKNTIAISRSRDLPMLRQIHYSAVVSHSQLFQFMLAGHCEQNLESFNWRVRRLVKHGLVRRQFVAGSESLYTVTNAGVTCLEMHGDSYVETDGNGPVSEASQLLHDLELNNIHLSLLRSGVLCNWTPQARLHAIVSRGFAPYQKAYDAVAEVMLPGESGLRGRIALEYERTLKDAARYREIGALLDKEQNVDLILYLAGSPRACERIREQMGRRCWRICTALLEPFKENGLDVEVTWGAGLTTLGEALRLASQESSAGKSISA